MSSPLAIQITENLLASLSSTMFRECMPNSMYKSIVALQARIVNLAKKHESKKGTIVCNYRSLNVFTLPDATNNMVIAPGFSKQAKAESLILSKYNEECTTLIEEMDQLLIDIAKYKDAINKYIYRHTVNDALSDMVQVIINSLLESFELENLATIYQGIDLLQGNSEELKESLYKANYDHSSTSISQRSNFNLSLGLLKLHE